MNVLEIVKSCPLFYELYDSEILSIVEKCQVIHFESKEIVFSEGDVGNEMYLILSGSATVEKNKVEIAKLRKGDLFGEMVLLKENDRKATVRSSTFTDVMLIQYDEIFGLFETNPKIFSLLMVNLSRMLATRLGKAGEIIEQLRAQTYQSTGS